MILDGFEISCAIRTIWGEDRAGKIDPTAEATRYHADTIPAPGWAAGLAAAAPIAHRLFFQGVK